MSVADQNTSNDASPLPSMEEHKSSWRSTTSTIVIIICAPLIALLLTMFVFQSYVVEGMSMSTTLHNHDRLIIWKTPRTIARATEHPFVPHRYDIIVFVKRGLPPNGVSNGGTEQLIKRVIGLPGERVVVSNGEVTVYNTQHPDGFNPDLDQAYGNDLGMTPGDTDITVPADHVFVLGDNRGNSFDSPDFGAVPVNDIIGKLTMRIAPLDHMQSF